MRKLAVFNQVSVDGYFVDAHGDMSWAGKNDPEWRAFAEENAKRGGELLFGRVTYDLMASYWPTPLARAQNPIVAECMNNLPKVVFSRTMHAASWSNTRVARGDLVAEVRRLKAAPGPGMAILGSGSVVSQLAEAGLIDEYQVAVIPVALGKGRTMFDGVTGKLSLKLTKTRVFGNGNVVLHYEPAP